MPRGGYRENAGRKQGAPNKATAARQAEVTASGITPLEVMLDNMRSAYRRALELEKQLEDLQPSWSPGCSSWAKSRASAQLPRSAPRMRPTMCIRSSPRFLTGNDPDQPLIITDAERAEAVLALLAKGGIDLH